MERFDTQFAFRGHKRDREDLAQLAEKWQLEEAEVCRRALRTGLVVLSKFKMPGVSRPRAVSKRAEVKE